MHYSRWLAMRIGLVTSRTPSSNDQPAKQRVARFGVVEEASKVSTSLRRRYSRRQRDTLLPRQERNQFYASCRPQETPDGLLLVRWVSGQAASRRHYAGPA